MNKLTDKQIEYWNTIKAFKKSEYEKDIYIVPPIPLCDKDDYDNVIIPNLIRCGAIPKDKLEIGATYFGECRNAHEATWDGNKFIYQRYEWGQYYPDKINHFMDDDGFDVFVPIEKKE